MRVFTKIFFCWRFKHCSYSPWYFLVKTWILILDAQSWRVSCDWCQQNVRYRRTSLFKVIKGQAVTIAIYKISFTFQFMPNACMPGWSSMSMGVGAGNFRPILPGLWSKGAKNGSCKMDKILLNKACLKFDQSKVTGFH